jgi:hypothetical protein
VRCFGPVGYYSCCLPVLCQSNDYDISYTCSNNKCELLSFTRWSNLSISQIFLQNVSWFTRSFYAVLLENFLHSSRNPKCQTRCTILHRHMTSCEISAAHGRQDEATVATYGMFFWLLVPGVNIRCVDLKNLSCCITKRQIVLVTLQWLELKVAHRKYSCNKTAAK